MTSIRLALDHVRATRTANRATVDYALAAELPTSGSVAALFGRRDAVLLLLAGAGLSHTSIATLDRSDVVADHDDLWVGGVHRVRVAALGSSAQFRPVDCGNDGAPCFGSPIVTRRRDSSWIDCRPTLFPDMHSFSSSPWAGGGADRPLGTYALSCHGDDPGRGRCRTRGAPGGHPSAQTPPPREHRIPGRADIENTSTLGEDEHISVTLDPGYYRAGIEARRRDHAILAGVSTLADDVEARIEQLLHRTLDLLGDTGTDDAR